jgi:SAM-dependent methyltransferase
MVVCELRCATMERVNAQKAYWDEYYQGLDERGSDLDWGGRWTAPFLPLLRAAGATDLLELGCGTGNDAARLAGEGFHVVATDLSTDAVAAARRKYGDLVDLRVVDMAAGLPFPGASFDAVMSNVALHMFTDAVTRAVFTDIRRVLRESGLFLFHVNAHDDRPLRERARPVRRELEPDYVLEEAGQTVRFFSRTYLDDLLADWQVVMLDHIEITHGHPDVPLKRVWRVAARARAGLRCHLEATPAAGVTARIGRSAGEHSRKRERRRAASEPGAGTPHRLAPGPAERLAATISARRIRQEAATLATEAGQCAR